jgi:hypothetical protein
MKMLLSLSFTDAFPNEKVLEEKTVIVELSESLLRWWMDEWTNGGVDWWVPKQVSKTTHSGPKKD